MKFFAALIVLIAGVSALPQQPERNIITDQIVEVIEGVSQDIKDAGLDPLHIRREAGAYALPVPVIFNTAGVIEEVLSTGLSNIVINQINYNVLSFVLSFDIELPHVHLSAESAYGEVTVFDNKVTGYGSGSIDVYNVRVRGSARVGIIGGISVRDISIDFTLGGIDSNLNINIYGYELSSYVNGFLGETVPNTHENFKSEIDELIEIVLLDYINANLFP